MSRESACCSEQDHHLHGVHRGWVKVSGKAPDALVWELGVGADA